MAESDRIDRGEVEVAPVRAGEDLDWPRLESYLREHMPELQGEFTVLQFPNGSANLTYLVRFGDTQLVVRRPPFGQLAPGAHDMSREFTAVARPGPALRPGAARLPVLRRPLGDRFRLPRRRVPHRRRRLGPRARRRWPTTPTPAGASASPSSTPSPTCTSSFPTRSASATSAGRTASSSARSAGGEALGPRRHRAGPADDRRRRTAGRQGCRAAGSPPAACCTTTTRSTTASSTRPIPTG